MDNVKFRGNGKYLRNKHRKNAYAKASGWSFKRWVRDLLNSREKDEAVQRSAAERWVANKARA